MAVSVINRYRFNTGVTYLTLFATDEIKGIKVDFSEQLDLEGVFLTKSNNVLEQAVKELKEFFNRERSEFDLPVASYSSENVKKVSEAVKKVKFGKTITLKELSEKVKLSEKEVEKVLLNNQFPILVPCHRVIKSAKSVGSYVGGEETKKALLDFEKGK